jgi:hypothetical protein
MPIFRGSMIAVAAMSTFLAASTAADEKTIPPPVVYGPPDNSATRVPPPGLSYLPEAPAMRRESVMSSVLFAPEDSKRSAMTHATSEYEPSGTTGAASPWRLRSEVVVVDPVTTVATDSLGVEEPVIINLVKSGLTHTLTTFIRRLEEQSNAFTVRNEWSYRASDGTISSGLLPLPAGYTNSADPVLAHNGTTGGIGPGITYMAGLAMNRASNLDAANPSSIRVWISVNGGFAWTGVGSEVDLIASGTTVALDKPWIAVSETGSTTGYVYVSWVRSDQTTAHQNQLMFRRSRNGVSKPHAVCCYPPTWDSAVPVTSTGYVHGPQIVIDSAEYVYVIFTDFATSQMRVARSRFPGANFPSDGSSVFLPAQTIATFNRIVGNRIFSLLTRVVPLPAARYNAATNEILVAWTEGETDNAAVVDVQLYRLTANTAMTATRVVLGSQINSAAVNQFTPVVETDGSGTVVLAYYDARGLSSNTYQQRVARLSSLGTLLPPVPPDTNPTPLGPTCRADTVGEYQGLWRGSYPAGFRYDTAWTCGASATNRTILRAGVQ